MSTSVRSFGATLEAIAHLIANSVEAGAVRRTKTAPIIGTAWRTFAIPRPSWRADDDLLADAHVAMGEAKRIAVGGHDSSDAVQCGHQRAFRSP